MPYLYGTELRAKPIAVILRGFDPNQPRSKTVAAKVADGVTIKSGQQISLVATSDPAVAEWVLGLHAEALDPFTYTALQDSDDFDVRSADSLVGYSPLGDFVIQTGYFDDGEAYPIGTPLTPDGTTGDLTVAGSGDPVVGYVTKPVTDLKDGGATGYPSNSNATDAEVIAFQTAWVASQPA